MYICTNNKDMEAVQQNLFDKENLVRELFAVVDDLEEHNKRPDIDLYYSIRHLKSVLGFLGNRSIYKDITLFENTLYLPDEYVEGDMRTDKHIREVIAPAGISLWGNLPSRSLEAGKKALNLAKKDLGLFTGMDEDYPNQHIIELLKNQQ